MAQTARVLVVDDDENVRNLVRAYLEKEDFAVDLAADGLSALEVIERTGPDVIVLDLMIPGVDGLEVARQASVRKPAPAVLMLTAKTEESDILVGFGAGADDYLTKPFSPKVLVARVKALLRRSQGAADETARRYDNLEIRPMSRETILGGRPLELTQTEFDILLTLSQHPGWVYTRDQLLEQVWGYEPGTDSRVVDVHVANLRRKLGEDATDARYVQTVRGVGYKFMGKA